MQRPSLDQLIKQERKSNPINLNISIAKTKLDYYDLNSDHQILFQDEASNQPSSVQAKGALYRLIINRNLIKLSLIWK